ncbi:Uncharacterised protein [Anaerotruncus sp. 2789STDY5834896]|uniref:DUF4358 domain-containing protein n=1 Tax=uncultured Anaerotruncus sp. TaxID=905011 RepID=A0A1C6I0L3_9FIRM|nr:Uncharacterised protein [uncultured Anaerotruncus sp.]
MKRALPLLLAALCCLYLFAGCGQNGVESPAGSSSAPSAGSYAGADSQLKKAREAARQLLGENYIPSAEIPADLLEEQYGLSPALYDHVLAEGPLMSAHVDLFIGVHASAGHTQQVLQALQAYRQKMLDNTMNYPQNALKIPATQVFAQGDYVFLVLLGAYPPVEQEMDDEQTTAYFAAQNQQAVDAIKASFQ